jgi:anaerobic selenocysteine-containing dehydrogenase
MITSASNPLVSHANTDLVYRALKKLDLYVALDVIMGPSAQLADYVLPAASWLEREQLWSYLGYKDALYGCHAALPASTPSYDRRDDFTFWKELGIRLGQRDDWPWETLKDACDDRMKNCALSFDELCKRRYWKILEPSYRKYEADGFGTPTGKIELYSTIFEELGYDPLPYYKATPLSHERSPEISKEYPLILINGSRSRHYMHAQWREVESVRRLHPDPEVQIHPETAARFGIEDGDWIWIETPKGRIRQRCKYFTGIKPQVVHAEGQWWYPESPGQEPFLYGIWISNMNVVLDDDPENCNEVTGGWPQRHTLCRIFK